MHNACRTQRHPYVRLFIFFISAVLFHARGARVNRLTFNTVGLWFMDVHMYIRQAFTSKKWQNALY